MKKIQLLDATIRDGGFGFEDAEKNGWSEDCFDPSVLQNLISHLEKSCIDIIEIGAIEISKDNKQRFGIFQNIQEISAMIPLDRSPNQMYVALYRGPDTPIENIPKWNPSYCDGLRVILRYSELQKSLEFCRALCEKGYRVFIQPMLTMRYTEAELNQIICAANSMHAYALYFVDSYGYMQDEDIERFFQLFDQKLDKDICIGFHAHNNMDLAFSNAKSFLKKPTERTVIIDSCMLGIGQGAGNLQTEIIADHLAKNYDHTYNYTEILEACEIIERYWTTNMWGYSIEYFLPTRHKSAYKFAVAMRRHYGMSLAEIDLALSAMPPKLRHRYTPQDLKHYLDEWRQQRPNESC